MMCHPPDGFMSPRTCRFAGKAAPNAAQGVNAMKKEEVEVGASYSAKVGNRTMDIRIENDNAKGGWNGTAVDSGKPVRIKDARQLRGPAGADGERTVEPADDAAGADDPEPRSDKGKKRGGKKTKAPKENTR